MIYDDKKFIGNVIRNARKQTKMNQAELSEKLCMSEKNLSNIENGRQYPQVNNFLRIIEVLNLTLEDFGVNRTKQNKLSPIKNNMILKILSCPDSKIEYYARVIQIIDDVTS